MCSSGIVHMRDCGTINLVSFVFFDMGSHFSVINKDLFFFGQRKGNKTYQGINSIGLFFITRHMLWLYLQICTKTIGCLTLTEICALVLVS